MQYAPLVVIVALLLVMVFLSNRAKQKRAATDAERRQAMVIGTRVMTTSGMYGTITAIDAANDGGQADTVVLEIAPGTEVTWALVAVREAPVRAGIVEGAPAPGSLVGRVDDDRTDGLDGPDDLGSPVRLGKPKARGEH